MKPVFQLLENKQTRNKLKLTLLLGLSQQQKVCITKLRDALYLALRLINSSTLLKSLTGLERN